MQLILRNLPAIATRAAGWICAGSTVYFMYRWYTVRKFFRRIRATGVPMMPHSLFWGHLGILASLPPADQPMDAYGNYMHPRLLRNWKTLFPDLETCPHVWYIDFWPLIFPVVMVSDPEVSAQYMTHPSAPKDEHARNFIYPLSKNLDLVTSEGALWKTWRSRFNPGFSGRNLLGLLPDMIEEIETYVDLMSQKAGKTYEAGESKDGEGQNEWGEMFTMEEYTTNMTFDVIGRAALGVKLGSQRGNGSGLREILAETVGMLVLETNIYTLWKIISPWANYKLWRNQRAMNKILMPQVEMELKRTKQEGYGAQKTVLELGVSSAKAEVGADVDISKLDPTFVEAVLAHLKVFLFAGHDTTATSLCWIFFELQKNPEVLRKMREEHNSVFGKDVQKTKEMLEANPALVNSVTYTQAVVKETMRLHPNIASARQGSKSLNLVNVPGYEHIVFPTAGLMIWDGMLAMHTRGDLWCRPDEFIPERWMVEEGHELHPPKNTWRPFSIGPRNCIGQELAMLEMKLTMVLMARSFDVEQAWDEWDKKHPNFPKPLFFGERLYQVLGTTPHPKHGMPVHVRVAKE